MLLTIQLNVDVDDFIGSPDSYDEQLQELARRMKEEFNKLNLNPAINLLMNMGYTEDVGLLLTA